LTLRFFLRDDFDWGVVLPLDVHLHPSEAAISHSVVNCCVRSVGTAEGVMSTGVQEIAAFAKGVKE
jgi:hypothetical protein